MPEQPPAKLHAPHPARPLAPAAAPPPVRYVELHCKTNFSFLEGASHPSELVETAAALGYAGMAVTDRNSLTGVVRAHVAAKEVGLKLVVGAEVTMEDAGPVLLWAMDRGGYGRLCRLLTRGRRQAPKGECRLAFVDVAEHAEGLLIGVLLPHAENVEAELARWREVFLDRTHAVAELHRGVGDERRLELWRRAARTARRDVDRRGGRSLPRRQASPSSGCVDRRSTRRHGRRAGLLAVSQRRATASAARRAASTFRPMPRRPDGRRRGGRPLRVLARGIAIRLSRGAMPRRRDAQFLPGAAHVGRRPRPLSRRRARQGGPAHRARAGHHRGAQLRGLFPHGLGSGPVRQGARHSLPGARLGRQLGRLLLPGRHVRRSRSNRRLVRAVHLERPRWQAPDIDVDFEHQRREEVIQYLYDKYGRERAGMTAELITYRPRSAMRDVGKALGLSLDRVDALAKSMGHHGTGENMIPRVAEAGLDPTTRLGRQLIYLVREILGFPRHLSQHVGGMVLTQTPLCEITPIENASMPGRTVVEWDKNDLDALGILKVDCLALGMLSAIRRAFDLLKEHEGQALTLATIPAEDPVVYEMIQRADTVGVFQIESRAQMSMLPRLKPNRFYDLVIEVAIVRPGPIQGKMVHPYLRRRSGQEAVEYPSEEVREVLAKTLGVPLFQEQAMRLVVVAAGFTPGEADQLRRAMGAWRRNGVIEQFGKKLIDGMLARGYTEEFARNLFGQIEGFGSYGFPESHAASFALLVYVSCWIKCHHPAVFLASLLNSQPMGFYAPAQLVSDARGHGVEIRSVDVNQSDWDSTLERRVDDGKLAVRLGWSMIKGLSRAAADKVVEERQAGGRFTSYGEFVARTRLSTAVLSKMSAADVFRSLGLSRRPALWQSLAMTPPQPLLAGLPDEEPPPLPRLSPVQEVIHDYYAQGLSLRGHPFDSLREWLEKQRVVRASALGDLKPDRRYRVAGLVLLRQRPQTAKGITFMTLEDETGTVNLIVRLEVWERYRRVAHQARALIAAGLLQRQDGVTHVIVDRLQDLTAKLPNLGATSRDFH